MTMTMTKRLQNENASILQLIELIGLVSHLRVWLSWNLVSKLKEFVAGLSSGEWFTGQRALDFLRASNPQAVLQSVFFLQLYTV